MPKARWSHTFAEYALCLVAFSIPFPFIFSVIAIGILALAWITQLNFKDTFINLKERKPLWLWIIFYILLAASYTYSDNKEQSSFDLQQKMSFVILPVIIGAGIYISRSSLERIFVSFVAGMLMITLWCFSYAAFRWYETGDTNVFFYHELIKGLEANAVYMAWYSLFAITLLFFMKWETYLQNTYLKVIVTLLLTAFLILLSSRLIIALFFVILVPFYLISIFRKFSRIKQVASVSALIILAGLLIFTKNPIRARYENILQVNVNQAYLDNYSNVHEGDFSNLTLRLFLWRVGILNMNEHQLWLTGAGNGDVYILQNAKMEELGIRNMSEPVYTSPFKNVNLHNMFMQTLLMVGLPGLLVFLLITLLPFAFVNQLINHSVFLLFHIIAVAFMMQEAALQTQAGVIFYTFFSQIFWSRKFAHT